MFKAKVRKAEEKILNCRFEDSDYPLINFSFLSTSFKIQYLKEAIDGRVAGLKEEEKPLLDIIISEAVILKMSSEPLVVYAVESASRTAATRLAPSMHNIISDILYCSIKPEFKGAYLTAKVAELLILVLSAQESEAAHQNWSEQDRCAFRKVWDLLGQDLKANYSIEELAIVAGMNRTKLQQGFKDMFNKTIYTFSSELKMFEAKALLTKKNCLSIKEVAAILGYKHVNHFSVTFKKKFNISPSYFKKFLDIILPIFLLNNCI
jgi:AraC-like DNA-binding protein